jgi:tight adherence protein B
LLTSHPYFALGVCSLALGIPRLIGVFKRRRVAQIEKQVEGWLTTLARALEAAPSLGEAVEVSAAMSDEPLRDELDVVVSELHLGRPLDRALSALGDRVGSRTLALALSTLQVGRATGGGLPEVLRSAAAALAELERLEGVVRTKTAEGKVQAWTISVIPLPVYFAVRASDVHYFEPLEQTGMGHVLTAVAVCLWLVAIFSARKILAVRI